MTNFGPSNPYPGQPGKLPRWKKPGQSPVNRAGEPIYIHLPLDGLTITITTPIVFQLPQLTVPFDALHISPGLCLLTNPPFAGTVYFNSPMGMRIYDQKLVAFGKSGQFYVPQGPPIYCQSLGVESIAPWSGDLDCAIEFFTVGSGALLAPSFLEVCITPISYPK